LVYEDKVHEAGIKGFLMKPVRKRDIAFKIRCILDAGEKGHYSYK